MFHMKKQGSQNTGTLLERLLASLLGSLYFQLRLHCKSCSICIEHVSFCYSVHSYSLHQICGKSFQHPLFYFCVCWGFINMFIFSSPSIDSIFYKLIYKNSPVSSSFPQRFSFCFLPGLHAVFEYLTDSFVLGDPIQLFSLKYYSGILILSICTFEIKY